jgi:hypothetical protein
MAMEPRECPKCGLVNPGTALRCDCGYNFSIEGEYHAQKTKKIARKQSVLRKYIGTSGVIGARIGLAYTLICSSITCIAPPTVG